MAISAWLIFYAAFLVLALLTAIISNFKDRLVPYAYTAIVVSCAVPLIHILFIAGKPEKVTATTYQLQEFLAGNIWAVLIASMYIYLAVWIILFVYGMYGNNMRKISVYLADKGKAFWITAVGKIKEQAGKDRSAEKNN